MVTEWMEAATWQPRRHHKHILAQPQVVAAALCPTAAKWQAAETRKTTPTQYRAVHRDHGSQV